MGIGPNPQILEENSNKIYYLYINSKINKKKNFFYFFIEIKIYVYLYLFINTNI